MLQVNAQTTTVVNARNVNITLKLLVSGCVFSKCETQDTNGRNTVIEVTDTARNIYGC